MFTIPEIFEMQHPVIPVYDDVGSSMHNVANIIVYQT